MANCVALDYNDPSEINRALINGRMYHDVANLKKRKFYNEAVEKLDQPSSKYICCEVAIDSECDSFSTEPLDAGHVYARLKRGPYGRDVLGARVESAHDSNNFPVCSYSAAEVKSDAGFGNADSSDEASSSWPSSRSGMPALESRIVGTVEVCNNEVLSSKAEHYTYHDTGWQDMDCHEASFGAVHFKDSKQHTAEGLEGFLSSTGLDPNLFQLSSDRWAADQEAQLGRRKPTIDQEFEQYFSMLML